MLIGGYSVVLRGTGEAAPEPRLQLLLNGALVAMGRGVAQALRAIYLFIFCMEPHD